MGTAGFGEPSFRYRPKYTSSFFSGPSQPTVPGAKSFRVQTPGACRVDPVHHAVIATWSFRPHNATKKTNRCINCRHYIPTCMIFIRRVYDFLAAKMCASVTRSGGSDTNLDLDLRFTLSLAINTPPGERR